MTGQLRLARIAVALHCFGVSIDRFWRASGLPAGLALGFAIILAPRGRTRSI